jgi:hypothetical protein
MFLPDKVRMDSVEVNTVCMCTITNVSPESQARFRRGTIRISILCTKPKPHPESQTSKKEKKNLLPCQ